MPPRGYFGPSTRERHRRSSLAQSECECDSDRKQMDTANINATTTPELRVFVDLVRQVALSEAALTHRIVPWWLGGDRNT